MVKKLAETEVVLVIFAQSQIDPGLGLAKRLLKHGSFHFSIVVYADSSERLEKQVASRVESDLEVGAIPVSSFSGEPSELIKEFDKLSGLRIVLLPGLDQLDEQRLSLLKGIHATTVCFESHLGLQSDLAGLWSLGEDSSGDLTWFAEHLASYPTVKSLDRAVLDDRTEYEKLEHSNADWVMVSADDGTIESRARQCKSVIESAVGPVLLIRSECSWWQWLTERQIPEFVANAVPQMEREQRRSLSQQLEKYASLDFEFIALISASSFLASFGLLQNSAAVIIGAMLVAPLMTPILGAGLALAHGNRPLFRSSLRTISLGFLAALLTSCCFGCIVRFLFPVILDERNGLIYLTSEMWSRTHPTGIDFLVGLVGGAAAAFARTRSHLADALAGAAIAAALVPPISTAGLHIAFTGLALGIPESYGSVSNLIYGPVLLFVANMLTIMIGSSFVLWACGIRADHGHSRKEKWTTRMTFLLVMLTAIVLVWIIQHP
ncbi:MAG: DUF389 domain-containing protein [Aureliella sp.]